MEINSNNVESICNNKCKLNVNYCTGNTSNVCPTVSFTKLTDKYNLNSGLSDINGSSPPVVFNNVHYTVASIYIVYPSTNSYSADAGEFVILHKPTDPTDVKSLYISIPICESSDPTTNVTINDIIINTDDDTSPTYKLSINALIPKNNFYMYITSDNSVVITFPTSDAGNYISVSSEAFNVLKSSFSSVTPTKYIHASKVADSSLFKSEDTTDAGTPVDVGDTMIIDCSPLDMGINSDENLTFSKSNTTNPWYLYGVLIFIGLIILIAFITYVLKSYFLNNEIALSDSTSVSVSA